MNTKIITTLLCLVNAVCIHATDNIKSIVITKTDATTVNVNLSTNMTTTFTDNNLVLADNYLKVSVPFDEIAKVTYSDEYVISTTQVLDFKCNKPIINIIGQTIEVSGVYNASFIDIYSINGHRIKHINAENQTIINLQDCLPGLYILVIGDTRLKVII